jgi:tetratricopeptide (TPR) repeat protein
LQSAPSAYAQGGAAALSLLDKFGGDNKGAFHIFLNREDAQNYVDGNGIENSCYDSESDIPGEKNYMIIDEGLCLSSNTTNLYFAFFNNNYVDDETVVLEVMPWIDNEASRGWTIDVKENFINNCKGLEQLAEFSNPEKFCQCILDNYQENYSLQDFQKLTSSEINKITEDYSNNCLSETGELENIYENERTEAKQLAKVGKYGDAILKLQDVITNGNPTVMDYNNIGWYYILTKQYLKAIKYLKEGEKIDETELLIKGNLAHALLLSGEIEQAKAIYLKYKNQNINENRSWIQMVTADFETFKTKDIISDQFDIILTMLK